MFISARRLLRLFPASLPIVACAGHPPARCPELPNATTQTAEEGPPVSGEGAPTPPADRQVAGNPLASVPNARQVRPGLLVGGEPSGAALVDAQQAGYRTVIDLLPHAENSEEARIASQLGLDFVALPIEGPRDLTRDNAVRLGQAMAGARGPILLHCSSGNRAAALLALHAHFVDGKTPDEALALGRAAGLTQLEGATRERLGLPVEAPTPVPSSESSSTSNASAPATPGDATR